MKVSLSFLKRGLSMKVICPPEFWVCRSTFGYRSRMPSNVVYSPDGSLIAVSYGLYAVIYDVASNGIRTTLTCPDLRDISHMCFIGETGQYFVITDNCMIYVWDLVALTGKSLG